MNPYTSTEISADSIIERVMTFFLFRLSVQDLQ